jgi:hypothetical protein
MLPEGSLHRLVLAVAVLCAAPLLVSAAEPGGTPDLGKEVFTNIAQPPCGVCHTPG